MVKTYQKNLVLSTNYDLFSFYLRIFEKTGGVIPNLFF